MKEIEQVQVQRAEPGAQDYLPDVAIITLQHQRGNHVTNSRDMCIYTLIYALILHRTNIKMVSY